MSNKGIISSIKTYKCGSIFLQYMFFFFIVFAVFFSVLVVLWNENMNSKAKQDNEIRFYDASLTVQQFIDDGINSVNNNYLNFKESEDLEVLYKNANFSDTSFINAISRMTRQLNNCVLAGTNIVSVYLYSPENDYVFTTNNEWCTSNYTEYFVHQFMFDNYKKNKMAVSLNTVERTNRKCYFITVIYPVETTGGKTAYLAYNLDVERIASKTEYPVCINDAEGKLLYASHTISKFANYKKRIINVGNDNFEIYVANNVKVNLMPGYMYALAVLIIILLSAILSSCSASVLYIQMDKICNVVQLPINADDVEGVYDGKNELSNILMNIRQLVIQREKNQSERDKLVTEFNKVQATALQLQISPHFIFNTLNLISSVSLVETRHETKITIIVEKLSHMLYAAINTNKIICNFREELSYTKDYLQIQHMKYENFDVIYDIDDVFMQYPIVKFTLQPILENALHHGILACRDCEGLIMLSAEKENDRYYIISIRDNGAGMTDAEIKALNDKIKDTDTAPSKSIALWNTNKRLELSFGKPCGITVKSSGNGCEVLVRLPIISTKSEF